jgi:tRNA pseudouridine55 synthase
MRDGILIIDKPAGLTSHDVVHRLRRAVQSRQIGHAGTLDPMATGVLVVCLGQATRVSEYLLGHDKAYRATIRLGVETNTYDADGEIVAAREVNVNRAAVERALAQFVGELQQVPPMYSAIKRQGTPLYKLARQGIEVERASRTIQIDAICLTPAESDCIRFQVFCSKGTYVRVLAEDIGRALGTVAHLEQLRRTRFGSFDERQAVDLEQWHPNAAGLLSIREALRHLPFLPVDAAGATAARRGQGWWLAKAMEGVDHSEVVLIDDAGDVVAVVERQGPRWHFARVLSREQSLHGNAPMVGTDTKQTGKTEDGWD